MTSCDKQVVYDACYTKIHNVYSLYNLSNTVYTIKYRTYY